jgi:hypothetical protein
LKLNILKMKSKGLTIVFSLLIGVIIVLSPFDAKAQNKVLLMNGAELEGKAEPIDSLTTKFHWEKKGKIKEIMLDNGRIFSYTLNGVETLVYYYDPEIGNIFTISEMRAYILGEQQALENYKSIVPSVASLGGNAAVGTAFGFSAAILPAPLLTAAVFQVLPTKKGKAPEHLPENEKRIFKEGFRDTARPKKLKRTLLWSTVGLVGGIIVHNSVGQ